jgi:hypothetical protein
MFSTASRLVVLGVHVNDTAIIDIFDVHLIY